MTLPLSPWEAILGKFFAAWAFIGLALVLTFPMWITVNVLGQPDNGVILASYLGSFLMAGAYLAIASCISALTKNQVIAFIVAATLCFLLVMSGHEPVQNLFRAWAPDYAGLGHRLAELPLAFREHHQGHPRSALHRLLPVADRLRPVRQQDHHRSAQGRLRVSSPWLKQRRKARAVDRAAAAAGGFNRRTLAWGGVALAAITLLSVNLIASSALREARFDLTKERLFTISEGTRKALRAIDEPIDVRVYFSKKLGEVAPNYAKSFERVRTMLEQYREIARGKLQITYLDPEPFSDAEDRAVAAGLKGVRLNQEGEMGYFGIVGTNSTDTEANLPFLAIDRERFLEYDVTKLIVTLANQRKSTVGLISGIPIEGSPGNPMLGRPPTQGPLMIEHIKEFFEVKSIAKDAKEIPADIGVLMVVQPEGLSPETAYAIDQFALSGGKVLAFVDPVAEMSRQGNPMFMMMQGPPDLAEFDKLLKAWGVAFDTTKVAADIERARRVQFGSGPRANVTSYVLWLGLKRSNLDERDVLAGDIKELNFASAGFLEKAQDATTQFAPIVRTTSSGMQVPAETVSMMPDAVGLLRNYKPGGTPLVLAARVSGEAKSAFPDGRPQPPPPRTRTRAETPDAAKDKAARQERGQGGRRRAKTPAAKTPAAKTADKKGAPDRQGRREEDRCGRCRPRRRPSRSRPRHAPPPPRRSRTWPPARSTWSWWPTPTSCRTSSGSRCAIFSASRWRSPRPQRRLRAGRAGEPDRLRRAHLAARPRRRRPAVRAGQRACAARRSSASAQSEQVLTARLKEVQTKLAALRRRASGDDLVLTDKDRQEIEKFRGDCWRSGASCATSSASCARTSTASTACSSSSTSRPCPC